MTADDFCRAFCDLMALNEVPIGYVLRTPFRRPDGDPIAIYLRRSEQGTYRLEDDGQTIALLADGGVDFDSETRYEVFTDLLKEHDARWDENESLIHTDYLSEQDVPFAAVSFSALLLRVIDMTFLASHRVRSTFKDDLIALVERQFGAAVRIELDSALQNSMRDYPVDIIVRSNDGRALAIFAATSELKALEAILFWREYRDQKIETVRAMLVMESGRPRDIKTRTLTRVMNSGLLLAAMDGDEVQIGRKMQENLVR
jgi:uncharacterized protein DUF1828